MKIGRYEIHAIETGRFALDGGAMFGVVPKPLWEKTNPPDESNRISLAARALLLVGDGRKVLIDVGNGDKYSEKLIGIYKFDTTRFNLGRSLAEHGLTAADITDVILTHLHFDHAGGSTVRENGALRPTFPSARYYVQHDHWKAASAPTERDRASFFPDDFRPLQQHGVLEFSDGEGELLPGIDVRLVHGHTTALQCPVISDGKRTIFYCADLIPTTAHLALPWIMAYDLRPLMTLQEKRLILKEAVENDWVLFFEHDPLIEAARVIEGEKGIAMKEPVRINEV